MDASRYCWKRANVASLIGTVPLGTKSNWKGKYASLRQIKGNIPNRIMKVRSHRHSKVVTHLWALNLCSASMRFAEDDSDAGRSEEFAPCATVSVLADRLRVWRKKEVLTLQREAIPRRAACCNIRALDVMLS